MTPRMSYNRRASPCLCLRNATISPVISHYLAGRSTLFGWSFRYVGRRATCTRTVASGILRHVFPCQWWQAIAERVDGSAA